MGIATTITNNKKKSLLKSKIILNLDFKEEEMNKFSMNRNAIIVDILNKVEIRAKSFTGIHVQDYDITYLEEITDIKTAFQRTIRYEGQILQEHSYDKIRQRIQQDKVKIVNLIGKNGVISREEYVRL